MSPAGRSGGRRVPSRAMRTQMNPGASTPANAITGETTVAGQKRKRPDNDVK